MKGIKYSLAVVALSLVTLSCGEKKDSSNLSEIKIRLQSSITSLDPIKVIDANTINILYNAYSHLYIMDENGKLVKDLVMEIKSLKNKKIWYIKIKPNIKFCNSNKEITAEDVKFSLERAWKDPKSKISWIFKNLKSIHIVDKYEIKLLFKESIDLPKYLSLPQIAIISKESFKQGKLESAGPYYIYSFKNNEVVLKNCKTSSLKPLFDKVIFKVIHNDNIALTQFKKGKIDLMQIDPILFKNLKISKENVKEISNPANFYFIVLNTKKLSKDLRKALISSVDTKKICYDILKNICKPVDFVSAIKGYSNSLHNYIPLRKKFNAKLQILTLNKPEFILTAEYLSNIWEKSLGIHSEVKIVSFENMLSTIFSGKDYDGALIWVSPKANLLEIWHLLWNPLDNFPPKGRNVAFFYDKDYEKLFHKYLNGIYSLYDEEFLQKIEKVLEKNPPAVPLYSIKVYWLVKGSIKDKLHIGRFNIIKLWDLKE